MCSELSVSCSGVAIKIVEVLGIKRSSLCQLLLQQSFRNLTFYFPLLLSVFLNQNMSSEAEQRVLYVTDFSLNVLFRRSNKTNFSLDQTIYLFIYLCLVWLWRGIIYYLYPSPLHARLLLQGEDETKNKPPATDAAHILSSTMWRCSHSARVKMAWENIKIGNSNGVLRRGKGLCETFCL